MNRTSNTITIAILALVGCRNEQFDLDLFGKGKYITFTTDLVNTRVLPYTEGSTNDFKSMGVYAACSPDDFDPYTPAGLMDNRQLIRQNGSTGWFYTSPETPISWQGTYKHSFFAYAPYNATGLTRTNSEGIPQMTFAVQDLAENQVDLLVAEAHYNRTDSTTQEIRMVMHHALTRMLFSAQLANVPDAGVTVNLTQIELTGISSTASRPMDFRPSDAWNGHSTPKTYTLTNGTHFNGSALTTDLRQPITLPAGNLYLLPQNFPSGSTAELTVTYQIVGGGDAGTYTKKVTMADILDGWLPGEAIHYIITLPNPAQPSSFGIVVQHLPWDNISLDANIDADPYLDITNINVSAYDAAITRIYYYTNIPAAQVSIEPMGRIGSNTGASFNLNEEFFELPGSNFHPPVDGRGWIDLINLKTSEAGERPNQGKQPLIIKFKAGKIIRNIVVQPVVTIEAAKQNSTPYIGTFHRWNETGERVVTWHLALEKRWTAEIVEDGTNSNHAELCIDRLASPDFPNNILYSYSPRNPEGATIDPSLRKVEGKGRVYFRVGWKSLAPVKANRYARIMVTIDGESDPRYIYCRQGENEEPITGQTGILFTLFNVAQPRTFVQYPTQVGMLYQWNRTKPWDPLAKFLPAGIFPYTYETDFSPERDVCPEGYYHPGQDALDAMSNILNYPPKYSLIRWGYYADGYFDRLAITYDKITSKADHRVEASTTSVASAGFIFFPPAGPPRSIFLSTGGDRTEGGELLNPGLQGGFWSRVTDSQVADAKIGYFRSNGGTDYTGTSVTSPHGKNHAHSVRCVKPQTDEAWIVRFNPNGGDVTPPSLTIPVPASGGNPSITLPPQPGAYWRTDYTFKGWEDKNGVLVSGSSYTFTAADVKSPDIITFKARWTTP